MAAARDGDSSRLAEALYELGLVEEAGYQYFAAERDLGRAVDLAPQDAVLKAHFQSLQRKLAAGSVHEAGASGP